MNRDEKALARIMFKQKVLTSDGQAFEDLFSALMQKANPNYTLVKPQGSIGDRKNDGYDRKNGVYYQVFAPEDIRKSRGRAVRKLNEDFRDLKAYWEEISPVKEFYFVFNDKYKGSFPEIEKECSLNKKEYKLDNCGSFLAKDIENLLFSLSGDEIISVVGFVPEPDGIENLDYSILNEVISHIMGNKRRLEPSVLLSAPDFDEKIVFNGLHPRISALLKNGSYQAGILENYFELNSDFMKQELRHTLNELYENAKVKDFDFDGKGFSENDLLFFNILDAITPKDTKAPHRSTSVVIFDQNALSLNKKAL